MSSPASEPNLRRVQPNSNIARPITDRKPDSISAYGYLWIALVVFVSVVMVVLVVYVVILINRDDPTSIEMPTEMLTAYSASVDSGLAFD